MELSAIGAGSAPHTGPHTGLQVGGQAAPPAVAIGAETGAKGNPAPAEARGQQVQRQNQRDQDHEPRNPVPQLTAQQAAIEAGRIALAQADTARALDGTGDSDLQIKALRAYEASTQVLDEVKALIDRVVLLPEKGDLSLEASQLPPYGPTQPSHGAQDGAALAAFDAMHQTHEPAAP